MKQVLVIAGMLAVLTMALFEVKPGQAVNCGEVESCLASCLKFLTGTGTTRPSPSCCNGVEKLKTMYTTTADRRAACECLKQAASRYTFIRLDKASLLPQWCGVQISVPITKDVDCNKVNA